MKNWLLYFFAVFAVTVTAPFAAKWVTKPPPEPIITLESDGEVSEMSIEEYAFRVLLAEGEKAENYETKKALAVAIRSEAYYLSVYGLKHENFDVCNKKDCCLPLGNTENFEEDYIKECRKALSETYGTVLTHGDKPAMALFTLCSGSGTSNCEDFPYLTAVREEKTCDIHITKGSFHEVSLSDTDSCVVYNGWGKCDFAVLDGRYYESAELQSLLGLPSAEFAFKYENGNLNAVCYGAGNGFGLNLCGADKHSESGKTFEEILGIYYPYLKINKIYNN